MGAPVPKLSGWVGVHPGCRLLCQVRTPHAQPQYVSTCTHLHAHTPAPADVWIHPAPILVALACPCHGQCQTGWAWVLPLGGHCSPQTALWDSPAHAAHSKHSMTQRHLPAQTPFWQHLCIPGCAHECLHMYLFIHTHTRAKTSVHAHVYICAFTCAHVPTSLHTRTHIQACSHPRHAGTHTCACTCSQKCLCTGVHTQGTVVCAYMSVHTHTHVSVRTYPHVCAHTDGHVDVLMYVYAVRTQACAHAQAQPSGRTGRGRQRLFKGAAAVGACSGFRTPCSPPHGHGPATAVTVPDDGVWG